MTRISLAIAFIVSVAVAATTSALQRARPEAPAPVDFRA